MARFSRARIGIAMGSERRELIEGLVSLNHLARLVVLLPEGSPGDAADLGLDIIMTPDPAVKLVEMLAQGELDGGVRGTVSASRTMTALATRFDLTIRRLALMQLQGWTFALAPVGIAEGDHMTQRLELAMEGSAFLRRLGVNPRICFLSGGRLEDLGRSPRVDQTLAEGELLARLASSKGLNARHGGILIEEAWGDDLIIAPDGICGNLIFRTLMYLGGAKSLGAPVLMDKVFVDSSRSRVEFSGPVALASALAGMRR